MGKKQHYVPQFYLRHFADDCSKVGFYRFAERTYRPEVPIKSILFENWLYDQDDSYETALSEKEKQWDISLKRILSSIEETGSIEDCAIDDLLNVLVFIAYSELRTSKNIHGFHAMMQSFADDFRNSVGEEAFDAMEFFEGFDDENITAQTMLDIAPEALKTLLDLEWLILFNATNREFITSDVPVISINPFLAKRKWKFDWGNGSVGIQKILPISPKFALCLYDSNVYDVQQDATTVRIDNQSCVRAINKLIAKNAHEQIVFNPSFPRCEAIGYCKGKNHNGYGDELRVYEDNSNQAVYGISRSNLEDDLLLPGVSINSVSFKMSLDGSVSPVRPFVEWIQPDNLKQNFPYDSMKQFKGTLSRVYGDKSHQSLRPTGCIIN